MRIMVAKMPPTKKKKVTERKIEQRDALVVGGQQPGANAVSGIEIMLLRQLIDRALVVVSYS